MRGDGGRTGRPLVEKAGKRKKSVPRTSFVVAVCSEAVCSGIVNVQRASGSSVNDPARVFKSRAS
jgi:hypothetical protein